MRHLVILCVDDDPDIQVIVKLSLDLDPDVELHQALSAEAAWEKMNNGLAPDIVLLDDTLPGQTGRNFMQRLRMGDHRDPPPVVFFSAACRAGDVSRFSATGAIGLITKPFDPLRLADDIRKMALRPTHFYVSM